MDSSRIPDFGRASIDQLEKKIVGSLIRKEANEADVSTMSADNVDLTHALEPEPDRKKWTVLLYMDGNNNLYAPMYDAMKSLESVGSDHDVNVVVELGGNPGKEAGGTMMEKLISMSSGDKKIATVGRYYVTKDQTGSEKITSPKLADLGIQDMGDPAVVSDFLEWGIKKYPAEHYAIIFFDHGAGFAGSLSDEASHSLVTTNQMEGIVAKAAETAGKKIDLVDFDACLMAQVEVAQALKNSADFMIASEETERGSAQPLARVIKDLQEGSRDQALPAEDLAKLFVYESFHQPQSGIFTTTLSAVDLQKIDNVVGSADTLAQAIMNGNVDKEAVRDAAKDSEHYCQDLAYKLYNDYHDLGHFAENIIKDPRIGDEATRKAAGGLLDAMGEAVIAVEHQGEKYAHSSGLSTYLPTNYGYDPKPKTDSVNFSATHDYEGLSYSKETHWDEMIKFISKDSGWHNFLSALGVSRDGMESLDRNFSAIGKKAMKLTRLTLGVGQGSGYVEAFSALKSGVPRSFLWMGSRLSAQLGALGGGYKVFKGAKGIYDACQDKPPSSIKDVIFTKKDKIVNGALSVAEGTAMLAVNAALLLGASAGITTAAGILTFALPVAKIIYDALHVPGNLKAKAEEMQQESPVDKMTVAQKLDDMNAAHGHLEK